jgi:hypothetical protein
MMTTKKSPKKVSRQRDQERLVKEALRQPGVATAIKVYSGASRYAPLPAVQPQSGNSYATGGNPR